MPRITAKPLTPSAISRMSEGWLWDSIVPGLGVRRHGRQHVFVFRWRDSIKTYRKVLGGVEALTLDAARQAVLSASGGQVPRVAKPRKSSRLTVQAMVDTYIAARRPSLRPSTLKTYEDSARWWLYELADMPVANLQREAIQLWYNKVAERHGVASGLKILRLLRAAGHDCAREHPDTLPRNPFFAFARRGIAPTAVEPKERLIPKEKLAEWWKATSALRPTARDFLRFLLLTGLRLSAAQNLKWSAYDSKAGVLWLEAAETKNKQRAEVPLGPYVLELLDARRKECKCDFVFPGRRLTEAYGGGRRACQTVGSAIQLPFSVHDLRRTRATIAAMRLSVSTIVLQRLLTHKTKAKTMDSRVTGGYVVSDADNLRPAATALENEILELAEVVVHKPEDESAEFWTSQA